MRKCREGIGNGSFFCAMCGNGVEGMRLRRGNFRADVESLNVETGNCGFMNFYVYIIAYCMENVNYMVFIVEGCGYFEKLNSTKSDRCVKPVLF